MRVGAFLAVGVVAAVASQCPAYADAIVRIVNASNFAVTVRIDGSFGCRAQSKAAASTDEDSANRCTFGATTGDHVLELDFDGGKSSSRPVNIPASGYSLTLTGTE